MRVGKTMKRGVVLAALFSLGACKTWEPAPATLERVLVDDRPSSLRVTTADGLQVTLKNPRLVNDSIVSQAAPPPGSFVVPPRSGVREGDVNLVEVQRFSLTRTLALAGAIAGASITWARIQGAGGGREPGQDPLPKDTALGRLGVFGFFLSFR